MTVERVLIDRLSVTIVSHGYGYGGDLMYFGEIFQQLLSHVPRLQVAVDRHTRFDNRYALPLLPLMSLYSIPLKRRTGGGQVYDTEIRLPAPSLLARLLSLRSDVFVVIEFTPVSLTAMVAAWLGGNKPIVLLVESDPSARGSKRNWLVRRIKRWAVRRATIIQTNNAKGYDYLVHVLRADPARVRMAPYLTSRPPGPEVGPLAHDGPLRLLFVNSLTPRKGLRQALAALAMIEPAQRNQIALTIIGDGPERRSLEETAGQLDMGERLQFLGSCAYADLGQYLANADVLLAPSLADYRSLATFEGLGYGLALLASVHDGATEETVQDGRNGFRIDPHDPQQLARRISQLAQDRDLLQRMRKASLDLYRQHFSVEAVAANLAGSIAEASAQTSSGRQPA